VYQDEAANAASPGRTAVRSTTEVGSTTMDARNEPLSPLGLWILQSQREILLRHAAGGSAGSAADTHIVFPDRR
jgi:hypothetical protein